MSEIKELELGFAPDKKHDVDIETALDTFTFYHLPIESATLLRDSELTFNPLNDAFEDNLRGLVSWSMNSEVLLRGLPGYGVYIYTDTLDEDNRPVKEDITTDDYQWVEEGDWFVLKHVDSDEYLVFDSNTLKFETAVNEIDTIFGRVKADSEPVLLEGKRIVFEEIGNAQEWNLQHASEFVTTTTFGAPSTEGFASYLPSTLYTEVEMEGYFKPNIDIANRMSAARRGHPLFLEIALDKQRQSVMRCFVQVFSFNHGEMPAETETYEVEFQVAQPHFGKWNEKPVSWLHQNDTRLQQVLIYAINMWLNRKEIAVKYKVNNDRKYAGKAFIDTFNVSSSVNEMTALTLNLQGTKQLIEL